MTNELQKWRHIDRKAPDASRYFQSLLNKAAEAGLAGYADEIKRDTILLSTKMAQRYTFGASGSITAETAQGLLESAMYCIGRRLKPAETGEALELLKALPLEQIWSEGKELLRCDCSKARLLLGRIQESALKTENIAYSGTLYKALPAFFAAYDIEYAAHEVPCLLDYPLCVEPGRLAGAEYILEYLKRLSIENCFCEEYSEQIEPLLRGYSHYWRELNINIFELALTNAIGRVLCGKDIESLDINEEDRNKLRRSLGKARTRLKSIVHMAAERICTETGFPDQIHDYVLKAAGQIVPRIGSALETGSLGAVFITLKSKDSNNALFNDAAAMDDAAFRSVTDEIRSCRHISDKLAIIKRSIKSIADFTDMLSASCLYGDEYDAVFETLGRETLALLYKRLPEDGAMHITEGEREWQSAFTGYLERNGKAEGIIKAAKAIDI